MYALLHFILIQLKKNIQGKTVLTVEDNGSRAIIKKLSSK